MIDNTDIESIDKEHFEIIEKKNYTLVLRSKDTGHYWCLLEQVYNGHRFFRISHKHNASDPIHLQKSRPTVEEGCEYIRSHDAYHLDRIKKKEEHRLHRLGMIVSKDSQMSAKSGRGL